MIESLPPKAVSRAAAREQRVLEEDLALSRIQPSEDTASILIFCEFLQSAIRGNLVLPRTLSMEHWTFYVKTVRRLVAAGELPQSVNEDIETAFRDVFCSNLA
jgi:hypothetical protein